MIVRNAKSALIPDPTDYRAHPRGDEGWCSGVVVDHNPAYRPSAVLGPDGAPLLVGYERVALGFDLRPRK
jgi:hypothetical protein